MQVQPPDPAHLGVGHPQAGLQRFEHVLGRPPVELRRVQLVSHRELDRLALPRPEPGWAGAWYHERLLLRRLRPICQITYDRTARIGMAPTGLIRLTVDDNLRAWPLRSLLFMNGQPPITIQPDQAIIEMKYRETLPALFKEAVEAFALNAQAFSKYRMAVKALGFAAEEGTPAANPAPSSSLCLTC